MASQTVRLSRAALRNPAIAEVEEISGQSLALCGQCGKCSAGCPAADTMDLLPNQLIRALQLGIEEALHCRTIWLCASCLACTARCPNGLDLARLMEAARLVSVRRGLSPVSPSALADAEAAGYPQQAVVAAFRKLLP